jgi:hypothetical protein
MKQLSILFNSMGINRIIIDEHTSKKRIIEVLRGAIIKLEQEFIKIELS